MSTETEEKTELAPLWPEGFTLPNIYLSGAHGSGKTLFGALLDPEGKTLIIDGEDSSEAYENKIPFTRIDLPQKLAEAHPGEGSCFPFHLWRLFLSIVEDITPGKFRVGVIDPISEIEDALADHVRRNPKRYGLTANQVEASPALMWGAMKSEWKRVLLYLNTKFETVVLIAHEKSVFRGGRPVPGQKVAKGKDTLRELASLQLTLSREPDDSGKRPAKPSAVVTNGKNRLVATRFKNGELEVLPVLPDRLPEATGNAIREYMKNPIGLRKTRRKGETVDSDQLSEDDRLILRQEIAEEEARAEEARLERLRIEEKSESNPTETGSESDEDSSSSRVETDPETETADDAEPSKPQEREEPEEAKGDEREQVDPDKTSENEPDAGSVESPEVEDNPTSTATAEQLQQIKELKDALEIPAEAWKAILEKRDVDTARDLWPEQADQLIASLATKVEERGKLDELDEWVRGVLPGSSS